MLDYIEIIKNATKDRHTDKITVTADQIDQLACLQNYDLERICAYIEASYDLDWCLDNLDDLILYDTDSFEDLAYEFVQEGLFGGDIPDYLSSYIDYDAIGRDLHYDYTVTDYGIIRNL